MRTLHFDIVSGIAGDMTVAALAHLGADLEPLAEALAAMGLEAVNLDLQTVLVSGISARRFQISGAAEEHTHRTLDQVLALIARAGLPPGARERAEDIFHRLAEAEGRVHDKPAAEVTFHEVGALDSIADVVGCALGIDQLAPARITASEVTLGQGLTQSQHGVIPVPAPATLELLRGIPTRGLPVQAELTTPTGAAILASQVDSFCGWPDITPETIGYGAGSRDLGDRPNFLRLVLGEGGPAATEQELQVEANIDDMNPEHYAHLMELLLGAGAHDVWLQPVQMKKGRPAVLVSLLCAADRLEVLEHIIFRETTTIGLRRHTVSRRKLARHHETVSTPWGAVRIKVAGEQDRIYTASPEYEDCRARALEFGVPLNDVFNAALAAWHRKA